MMAIKNGDGEVGYDDDDDDDDDDDGLTRVQPSV